MIVDRDQFKQIFSTIGPGSDTDSPLWRPETHIILGAPSEWFVRVAPFYFKKGIKPNDFWYWARNMFSKDARIRCYSSGDEYEWWGFTNKDDAILFYLKWA